MLKDTIIDKLVTSRYKNMPPLQVAEYFEKLDPQDKSDATAALLTNDNTVAKIKIMNFMKTELDPIISDYLINGTLPVPLVEELIS
jgi:hypothetical protein